MFFDNLFCYSFYCQSRSLSSESDCPAYWLLPGRKVENWPRLLLLHSGSRRSLLIVNFDLTSHTQISRQELYNGIMEFSLRFPQNYKIIFLAPKRKLYFWDFFTPEDGFWISSTQGKRQWTLLVITQNTYWHKTFLGEE